MKFLNAAGLYVLLSVGVLFAQPFVSPKKIDTGEEILKKVSAKLNSVKTLKYKYKLELNYVSEGFRSEMAGDAFLDFTSVDKIVGFKYQFSNDQTLTVFNGSEAFACDKTTKLISIYEKPQYESFNSITFLFNSPVTLKNALPAIIADATIPKTIVNDKDTYVVDFVLDKKTLSSLGSYDVMEMDRKVTYRLAIDKTTYLPIEVLQTNSANKDYMKAGMSSVEIDSGSTDQSSWFYSTYLKDYKRKTKKADVTLISPGQSAPDWSLPSVDSGKTVSLSQFKNKVVLLEFWISQCGYCIAAVPKLNALAAKYKGKDFKLLAINAYDSNELIKLFQKNNNPAYETLGPGPEVYPKYGVEGYPVIVLVDKTGKVIYSGKLDEVRLSELIDENLK